MNRIRTAAALPLAALLGLAACASEGPDETRAAAESTVPEETAAMTAIYDAPVHTLAGEPTSLDAFRGQALLVVNVASRCGLTPQYAGLQELHETYADRGFTVVGFPCNQFMGQEPGSADEIRAFCDENYGVTFPLMEKVEVNGSGRHPIYAELTEIPDASGEAGDVQWNFEKFVVSADGSTITRFRPRTTPDDPELVAAIEAALP